MQKKQEGHRRASTLRLVVAILGIVFALSLMTATQMGPARPEGKY
jgi:hypothetical protein